MRATLTLAVATILLAGAATAQTAAPSPASAAPAPEAAKPKATGDTVSGVTVMPMPMPKKTCSSRDKDCIALVVAELKRLYPEQLKQFCFAEQTKAVRNQMVNDQIYDSLNVNGPPVPTAAPVSPIVKVACAPDKK